MNLSDVLLWTAIPFVCATIHLEDLKVKYRITTRRTIMETEPLTSQIVIFGAAGDLSRKN